MCYKCRFMVIVRTAHAKESLFCRCYRHIVIYPVLYMYTYRPVRPTVYCHDVATCRPAPESASLLFYLSHTRHISCHIRCIFTINAGRPIQYPSACSGHDTLRNRHSPATIVKTRRPHKLKISHQHLSSANITFAFTQTRAPHVLKRPIRKHASLPRFRWELASQSLYRSFRLRPKGKLNNSTKYCSRI